LNWICWGTVGLVWLVGAIYNALKVPVAKKQYSFIRDWLLVLLLIFIIEYIIPNTYWSAVTFRRPWLVTVGTVFLVAFTLFTLWARWVLGKMWSSAAMLKVGHELRTDGPYRITRHPIYTGFLGMLLGSTLMNGFGHMLPYLIAVILVFFKKIKSEEKLLEDAFGEQYIAYRKQVPALIPGIKFFKKV
jgi:protein-S-isoprenylcysteine O-methyltransferase Ste14